jgi:hypothetical protein
MALPNSAEIIAKEVIKLSEKWKTKSEKFASA